MRADSRKVTLGGIAVALAALAPGSGGVMARDGAGAKRVVDLPREQIAVAWSAGGQWLVTAPLARGNLMLVRADGAQTRPPTDATAYGNAWPAWQRLPS